MSKKAEKSAKSGKSGNSTQADKDRIFKKFISELLQRGRVKSKNIKLFTNEIDMLIFRKAFTHSSYDNEQNYELYEFLGDTTVNDITARYLHDRFPRIVSVKWLTKLKHSLVSKKTLGTYVEKGKWLDYILYGDEMKELIAIANQDNESEEYTLYISMLEDVFEAFTGAVVSVIDKHKRRGAGYAVAYNIVSSYLDTLDISLKYEDLWDPKTRIKELFDSFGWKFPGSEPYQNIVSRRLDLILDPTDPQGKRKIPNEELTKKFRGMVWETVIYGYPKGDKTVNNENRVELAKVRVKTKPISEQAAAEEALKKLEKYGIRENIPDPYENN